MTSNARAARKTRKQKRTAEKARTARRTRIDGLEESWSSTSAIIRILTLPAPADLGKIMQSLPKAVHFGVSTFLLGYTAYLYFYVHDWWIYGLLSGLSVVVSFLYCPSSFLWRLATSAAIVLGTLQALFLTWTIYSLKSSPLVEDDCHQSSNVLPEGRNILFIAAATSLSISNRLSSINCKSLSDYFRVLLLICLTGILLSTAFVSLPFVLPILSDVVTHTIESLSG